LIIEYCLSKRDTKETQLFCTVYILPHVLVGELVSRKDRRGKVISLLCSGEEHSKGDTIQYNSIVFGFASVPPRSKCSSLHLCVFSLFSFIIILSNRHCHTFHHTLGGGELIPYRYVNKCSSPSGENFSTAFVRRITQSAKKIPSHMR
jgi:hypothetical protein